MKLKGLHFPDGANIQEAVTEQLKKVPKKANFRKVFTKYTTTQKPVYMHLPFVSSTLKKKIIPNILDRTVYIVHSVGNKILYTAVVFVCID